MTMPPLRKASSRRRWASVSKLKSEVSNQVSPTVAEIDYGVGSERYKLDWMSDCRHIIGLTCFNPRSIGGLSAAVRHFGGRLRRRWLGNATDDKERN